MRHSHDWDFVYLYRTMYLKLSRMEKTLLSKNSYALWTTQEKSRIYRSLQEATEIAKRLSEGGEDSRFAMQFFEKYGFRGSLASLVDGEVEKIPEARYNQMYRAAIKKDKAHYDGLKKRFYYLLSTFGERWWD